MVLFFLSDDGSFEYIPNTGYSGEDFFTYRAFDEYSHWIKTKVTINVAQVTAIDNFMEDELAVTIYPNPANIFLRITLPNNKPTRLRMINLKGSIIYQKQITS